MPLLDMGVSSDEPVNLTDEVLNASVLEQCAAATHNLVRELAFDTARAHHKHGATGQRSVTEEAVMQSTLMQARSSEVIRVAAPQPTAAIRHPFRSPFPGSFAWRGAKTQPV